MEDKQATRTTRRPTRRIHETRDETIAENRMRRRDRTETASKQARDETKDKTHGRDEKRDGADAIERELIAVRWQLVFLPRRSHQLIATPITPRLPPRSVAPGLSFRLGSPFHLPAWLIGVSARFLFYRFVRFSSRPLVISSCSLVVSIAIPSGLAPIHDGEGSRQLEVAACGLFFSLVRRFPQLIIIRPVIGSSSTGRLIAPSPPWGLGVGSSRHLIRSVHLTRRPNCPISPSNGRRRGSVRRLSSKQRRHGGFLGSSSHPIISSHPRHEASRPPSRLMRLGRASRPHIPGHQRGRGGRSKQANTQNRDEKPGSKTGRRTERGRQDNGKRKNGTRTMASKAGEGATRTCGNHAQEQNAPHSFSPDPLAAGSHLFASLN